MPGGWLDRRFQIALATMTDRGGVGNLAVSISCHVEEPGRDQHRRLGVANWGGAAIRILAIEPALPDTTTLRSSSSC